MSYDSAEETRKHIFEIAARLNCVSKELDCRGRRHDQSKFDEAEKPLFDLVMPRLKDLVWGSDQYEEEVRALGPAVRHHYSCNSHHPEHYENGVSGMDLIDVIEMYCDWAAATLRHKDGDMCRTIETNIRKHRIEGPMAEILRNTWRRYGGFCGQSASNFPLSAVSVSAEGMAGGERTGTVAAPDGTATAALHCAGTGPADCIDKVPNPRGCGAEPPSSGGSC